MNGWHKTVKTLLLLSNHDHLFETLALNSSSNFRMLVTGPFSIFFYRRTAINTVCIHFFFHRRFLSALICCRNVSLRSTQISNCCITIFFRRFSFRFSHLKSSNGDDLVFLNLTGRVRSDNRTLTFSLLNNAIVPFRPMFRAVEYTMKKQNRAR